MSFEYDLYLANHKANVMRAFDWLVANVLTKDNDLGIERSVIESVAHTITLHDSSKYSAEEYDAYDNYFYGEVYTEYVQRRFERAWLHHIHNNKHHWQHWILTNDDSQLGNVALRMDRKYVVEMICDWWAFSWKNGNLYEIFDWWDSNKDYMILHDDTRKLVEDILEAIKKKLDEGIGI